MKPNDLDESNDLYTFCTSAERLLKLNMGQIHSIVNACHQYSAALDSTSDPTTFHWSTYSVYLQIFLLFIPRNFHPLMRLSVSAFASYCREKIESIMKKTLLPNSQFTVRPILGSVPPITTADLSLLPTVLWITFPSTFSEP